MTFNIRHAKENDYEQVERIMKQVQGLHIQWRPDIYKDVETVLPKDRYMDHVNRNEVLVAEKEENQIVGILIYVTKMISGGPMMERKVLDMDSMAVDEPYRGQGIGHKFFDFVKTIYKEKNYDGLELQVNAKNSAAMEMYEKYGFTKKSINMELL